MLTNYSHLTAPQSLQKFPVLICSQSLSLLLAPANHCFLFLEFPLKIVVVVVVVCIPFCRFPQPVDNVLKRPL